MEDALVYELVAAYSKLQAQLLSGVLVESWRERFPTGSADLDGSLFCLPKSGDIRVDGNAWSFARHGMGLRFANEGGVVVDAHTIQRVRLDAFDAWRVFLYLESMGAGVVAGEVERCFHGWLANGVIGRYGRREMYVLAD